MKRRCCGLRMSPNTRWQGSYEPRASATIQKSGHSQGRQERYNLVLSSEPEARSSRLEKSSWISTSCAMRMPAKQN
jgi:hypothetical protein